jgi:putative transposase
MTHSRYKFYETEYAYFLTCTVVGWLPVFTRQETVQIIFDSWRFLQENNRLRIYGYVIRYSSARNYKGLPGLFPVVTDWR